MISHNIEYEISTQPLPSKVQHRKFFSLLIMTAICNKGRQSSLKSIRKLGPDVQRMYP
jgi:hypothetical protein